MAIKLSTTLPCEDATESSTLNCDCSALTGDSFALARELLEQTGVAATPGLDFGSNAPEKYIRFAYTTGVERLAEAVERLRRHFGR